jgi:predicted P-loop ATPase
MHAARRVADANRYNSAREWLEALPAWDGVNRLDLFFVDVCGVEDNAYHRGVGLYFWASMVARMMTPGARADMAVVLTGDQGLGKTTLLRTIGGERYGTASFHKIGEPDWCAQLRGRVIVEFDEFAGHSRAEMETIKGVLTRTHDTYRRPYQPLEETHGRGNVFAATTNEAQFLTDRGGNRRWLPVQCNHTINVDTFKAMREQYFAEAFALLLARPDLPYWLVPDAGEKQDARVVSNHWEDVLGEKIGRMPTIIRAAVLLETYCLLRPNDVNRTNRAAIFDAMRALGFVRVEWADRRQDGGRTTISGFVASTDPRVAGKIPRDRGEIVIARPESCEEMPR